MTRVSGTLINCGAATQAASYAGNVSLTAFNAATVEIGTTIDMA